MRSCESQSLPAGVDTLGSEVPDVHEALLARDVEDEHEAHRVAEERRRDGAESAILCLYKF